MKILMPTWEYPPNRVGGVAAHSEGLATELARRGHDVHVVTYGGEEGTSVEEDVTVHRVAPARHDVDDVMEWVQLLNHRMREEVVGLDVDFDLVHAHDWTTVPVAVIAKELYRLPMVFTLHSTEQGRSGIHDEMSRMINDLEWYGTYEADAVITVGEEFREEVRENFGVPDGKLHYIPNGVDHEEFQRGEDVSWKYAEDWENIALFTGRLCHQKGVDHLVDAMPRILDEREDIKFVVAGKGDVDHYRGTAEHHGVGEKVQFTGYVPDEELRDLYASADMTVMPSVYEPFGIVALESMAAGTPVVGSWVGGIKETVTHEWDGLHTYPGNPDSIKWGVTTALQDDTWREWMGGNAEETVRERYTWAAIGGRTEEVYGSVTGTGS